MIKQWICTAALTFGALGLVACGSSQTDSSYGVLDVEPVSIHHRVAGSSSALKDPNVLLINDATTLENLQAPELTDIAVDFESQSLVVLALGECPTGGYWAHIDGVQLLGDKVIVQGTANRPAGGTQTQALTYPFEAVVVEKVRGTPQMDITSVEGQEHPSDEVMHNESKQTPEAGETRESDEAQGEAEQM